jgi:hypothetical protein
MVERDAAPAGGGIRTPWLPGGAGAPLGGTMTSRQELADGGPHGSSAFGGTASRKGPRQGTMDAPAMVARSAARRRKTLHGAPRGAASLSPQGRAMLRQSVDFVGRHAALHPLGWGLKELTGAPGALTNNTGDSACLGANRASPARAAMVLSYPSPGPKSDVSDFGNQKCRTRASPSSDAGEG